MDFEELLHEWKKFNLRDEEKGKTILLEGEEVKEIRVQLDHCLVGKILTHRNIAAGAIKNALSGAWKTRESFNVEVMGKNIFCFKFSSQEDRD